MICGECHGSGMVWSGPFSDGQGLRAGMMIPCPSCNGCGQESCCDPGRGYVPESDETEDEGR
jgi:hypothetical protein